MYANGLCETLISELGGSLSGGQNNCAGAVPPPCHLVLDEATSHMDVDNEAGVNASIQALKIIRVIIAHRPSTIASADRVMELE